MKRAKSHQQLINNAPKSNIKSKKQKQSTAPPAAKYHLRAFNLNFHFTSMKNMRNFVSRITNVNNSEYNKFVNNILRSKKNNTLTFPTT